MCVTPADTQLKKLVYLYLINYAKSNPDLTILAVNTFVKVRVLVTGWLPHIPETPCL